MEKLGTLTLHTDVGFLYPIHFHRLEGREVISISLGIYTHLHKSMSTMNLTTL